MRNLRAAARPRFGMRKSVDAWSREMDDSVAAFRPAAAVPRAVRTEHVSSDHSCSYLLHRANLSSAPHLRARARPYRTAEALRAASADAADERGAARSCTAARAAAASGDCGAMQFLLAATHFTIVHPCRSLLILSRRHSAVPCRCRPLRRFMLVRLAVERT